jgi:hypothetical protein
MGSPEPASMDDIKELRSSMDARMDELRDLIMQLAKPKESTKSSPKINADDLEASSDKIGEEEALLQNRLSVTGSKGPLVTGNAPVTND